jgi:pimeloyl-ACP methyl ester carboxylesterase
VILMLHGGQERSTAYVDGRSASWRRSRSMQRAIAPEAHRHGVSVWLLRYRERGWNGGAEPVADARWALDEVRAAHPEAPVTLLGHSMGARVAVHVADDPHVRGVVALAPWLPAHESVAALAGGTSWPHTGAETGSRRSPPLRRTSNAPASSPRARSCATWARSGTTCSRGRRRGTPWRSTRRWACSHGPEPA